MRNKIFSSLVVILFVTGLILLFGNNNTILRIENRQAKNISDVTADGITDSTFKDELNSVISDQMFNRDELISAYYNYKLSLNRILKAPVTEESDTQTVDVVSDEVIQIENGYLVRNISDINWDQEIENASNRAYNLQEIASKYPYIKLYVYMPTKIEQTDLLDYAFKENRFDEIEKAYRKQLWTKNTRFEKLEINTIEDYEEMYFRTDIHWNIIGAYKGYQQIIEMIQKDFDIEGPREVQKKTVFGYKYYGGNARKIGNAVDYYDHIVDYDLGIKEEDYKYYFDGYYHSIDDIKDYYRENGTSKDGNGADDYIAYFDTFTLKRVFDFDQEDKPNLLIFGDSYVNPVMPWIASHFNKTVVLDMRFKTDDFSLDAIMKQYDIDAVLNLQYYENMVINGNCFIPVN